MNREKEFVKNTTVLAIGKFLPKLTSFITLPILTAKLTKQEYGTYDLISTLVMLVVPIATLQIQSAAFRFLIDCRENKEKSTEIISNIFCVTIPITIAAGAVIQFFFGNISLLSRVGIAVYFVLDTLYLTLGQVARGLGNNKEFSIASIVLSAVDMICVVIAVNLAEIGLMGVIIALCLSNLVASVYLTKASNALKYIKFSKVSVLKIKELLSYSWPMVPNNLSNWVLKMSDRLVITAFLGVEANAVYAVANKIPNILSLAQGVIVMAWQENASIAVGDKDADKYYTRMLDQVFTLMISLTALLIGFVPIMFKLLIHGDYDDAYIQMPILIFGMFFYCMSAFQGGIHVAHKKTKSVGITTMFAAVINLIIDFLLINFIGISAGSVSTLTAYFLLYIFRLIDVQKFQPMKVYIKKQSAMLAIIVIMLACCIINNFLLNIANFVVGCTLFILCNREIILLTLKNLKKGI